eukprot:PhF_6_TR20017/c0_g1_i3/m.29239
MMFSLKVDLPSEVDAEDAQQELESSWRNAEQRLECDMDVISDNLHLGSMRCTSRPDLLRSRGIVCVVNASNSPVLLPGLDVLAVDLKDDDSCSPRSLHGVLKRCHDFISDALNGNRPVLVFCKRGISRSATIVATYLMARDRISWVTALERVKSRRRSVAPNLYFLKQMYVFERSEYQWDVASKNYETLCVDFETAIGSTTWGP